MKRLFVSVIPIQYKATTQQGLHFGIHFMILQHLPKYLQIKLFADDDLNHKNCENLVFEYFKHILYNVLLTLCRFNPLTRRLSRLIFHRKSFNASYWLHD